MKVFKRVDKRLLYLQKPTAKSLGIWYDNHLLLEGGYEEIDYKFHELTENNPEQTVAIGWEQAPT